ERNDADANTHRCRDCVSSQYGSGNLAADRIRKANGLDRVRLTMPLFFNRSLCDHAALTIPACPRISRSCATLGCTTREPSKTLATVPETRRSEQEIKCRKRADWSRTRLSAKVTTGPKLIEIVRNPHAEGQFNHVKGLKRD